MNTSAVLHFYFAMRWLSIRLDVLTTLVSFTVAIVVTLAKNYVDPSYAAIALVYAAKACALHQSSKSMYTSRLRRLTLSKVGLHRISYPAPAPAEIPPNFHIRPYPDPAGYGRRI